MTGILVDSNALLDVATEHPNWSDWSGRALEVAADASVLVITPIVFAEDVFSDGGAGRSLTPCPMRVAFGANRGAPASAS